MSKVKNINLDDRHAYNTGRYLECPDNLYKGWGGGNHTPVNIIRMFSRRINRGLRTNAMLPRQESPITHLLCFRFLSLSLPFQFPYGINANMTVI